MFCFVSKLSTSFLQEDKIASAKSFPWCVLSIFLKIRLRSSFRLKTRTHFAIEKKNRRSIRATSSQHCSGASRTSVIRSPGVCRDASCSRTSANRKRFEPRYLARYVNSIFTDVLKPMRITLYTRLSLKGSIILTRRKCSNLSAFSHVACEKRVVARM